jgi:signal transduction histidine kinase
MNTLALQARRLTHWSYIPFLLFTLSVLTLILWAVVTLWNLPGYDLPRHDGLIWASSQERIDDIEPQGPAARAGIQLGDQLLAVDGVPLAASRVLPYYAKAAGDVVEITWLRDGQRLAAQVELSPAALGIRLVRLEPLLVAFLFWIISLVTWGLRPFHGVTRIFFLLSQIMAAMLAAGSLSTIRWPMSSLAFNLFLTLMAPLLLHFLARFPEPLPQRFYRPLLVLAYGGALLVILAMTALPQSLIGDQSATIKLLRRSFVALTLVTALVLLFWRREPLGLQAQRRQLLIAGLLTSLSPLLFLSFVPELIYGTPPLDYVWTFPFLVLMPISYAYALQQGQLGKIELLLNRSLVYFLLIVLLLGLYMGFFLGLGNLLQPTSWSNPLLGVMLAVLVAGYAPLRTQLQHWIDRFFYGGWYNYRTVVRKTSSELSQVLDLERLVAQLLEIARIMRFQEAALLWEHRSVLTPSGSFGYGSEVLAHFRLPLNSKLVQSLAHASHPLWWDDLWHRVRSEQLTEAERTLARVPHMLLWLPLVSRGKLRAVLVLGRRQSDMVPDNEDLDILATVAVQAALAADNVTLVQTLRARLADVERMRDELARAHRRLAESHEEERRHLARELHDGAVQQLLGITYRLVESRRGICDHLPNDLRQREDLAFALDTTREEVLSVTRQLRGLIGELRPAGLEEFGLTTALEGYVARLRRETGTTLPKIHLDLAKIGATLPMPIALCLFRTAQESLRNAIKHAQAQQITVRLRLRADEVMLNIIDDGIGFRLPSSLSELSQHEHFGLIGMEEQVAWVCGELTLYSQPNVGTDILIRVPLQGKGAQL